MNLHVIHAGYLKLDGGAMFGVVPKVLWSRFQKPDENNLVTWAMRCLLIETEEKKILIDTGMGNKQDEKFFKHYYPSGPDILDSLGNLGFSPEDITDVILTHLHFDHCGGAVSKDTQGNYYNTFPNAKYWSSEAHFKSAINPNSREKASFLKENILPLQESGKLKFIDQKTIIIPELSFFEVHGHTKSMIIPKIKYKNNVIVYMADLLPSPTHIPPAWVMGYDLRPLETMQEKDVFFREAYANKYVLFYEHDATVECTRVVKTKKGFRASKPFSLSEI